MSFMDLHSHLLYGIDDGAQSLEDSKEMLTAAYNSGFRKITATPHVRSKNINLPLMKRRYLQLKPIAEEMGVSLSLGYEVHSNAVAEFGIEEIEMFCTEGTRTLLLEFSHQSLPYNWERIIYKLQCQQMSIIIAHPERYTPIQKNIDTAQRFVEMGCDLQCDILSYDAPFWRQQRHCMDTLIRRDMISYVASDAHTAQDYAKSASLVKAHKLNRFCEIR